jgi:hypothetical protein
MILRQFEFEEYAETAQGDLNSTTSVDLIAEPDAGTSRKGRVWVSNKDTAAVVVRLFVTVIAGPTDYEFDGEVLALDSPTVAVGGHMAVECPRLIPGLKITAKLDAAVIANQPKWVASWVDVPSPE